MKGKIGLVIYEFSVIVFYGIHTSLFLLAILNVVIYLASDFLRAYIIARPAMKKYEETVKIMWENGCELLYYR